jgi:excisionase family DNA binding protein
MAVSEELLPVPLAANRAGVARNTMLLAAKNGKIKAIKLGRDWFVYANDLNRWKEEDYRPKMIRKSTQHGDESG